MRDPYDVTKDIEESPGLDYSFITEAAVVPRKTWEELSPIMQKTADNEIRQIYENAHPIVRSRLAQKVFEILKEES